MMLCTRGFSDLLGHGQQRLFERQAGLHESGELAREQRQVAGGDAAREARSVRWRLLPRRADLGDGDRQQRALAQQLADVLDACRLRRRPDCSRPVPSSAVYSNAPTADPASVLARDAQDFFDRGLAAQHLVRGRHRGSTGSACARSARARARAAPSWIIVRIWSSTITSS